ncbi:unnamed protein product [Oppiella nova]|uniref:Carboxylesterase type B domain-containing protein n=1 Tax=Oppiella nova TaxID=334625 RepID=A0A7R9M9R9_9ACAR|nr:unnamed protein product [Oppiella nova]CAG2172870.1 unnamed protein product [Oppiella nova]
MVGVTKDEGPLLAVMLFPEMRAPGLTVETFKNVVNRLYDEYRNIDVEEVSDYYLKSIDTTNESQMKGALSALYGDLVFTCATYHFAKQFAKSGQNSNFYANLGFTVCSGDTICHGADLPYVFGSPLVSQKMFTETDYDFSIEIMKMLTDFAKNGKPHNVWPKLIDISDANSVPKVKDLNPNDMSLVLDNPYGSTCDGIWSNYF